ncbi:MAG: DUF3667 domain-containing protein [Cypionkella sp.]
MTAGVDGSAEGLGHGPAAVPPARTAVPAAAAAGPGHTREQACLNCQAELIGPHCHRCGQRAHVHRTIAGFLHDLLHGVLHFEGKIWHTLPLFAWQPGRLTREYIDGRRARYVSPIALFLFVVFLSFALFNALGPSPSVADAAGSSRIGAVEAEMDREIAKLEQQRAQASGEEARALEAQIAEKRGDRRRLGKLAGTTAISDAETNNDAINRVIKHVRENPQLAIYKAQTSAYKYSWLLIPLSVPFVWLLFPFSRRFRGYDHTVFVTYSIAFMIALVALASLLFYAGWGGAGALLLLYAPFHLYRQLRGTYALSRFGAAWRMLALSLFAWLAIGLFALGIVWSAGT